MNISGTTAINRTNNVIEITKNATTVNGGNSLVASLTEQQNELRKQIVQIQTDPLQTQEYKISEINLLQKQIQELEQKVQQAAVSSQAGTQQAQLEKQVKDSSQSDQTANSDDSLTNLIKAI